LHIEERVHFCGAARDVRPYLAAMDVFVLTSTAVETFSNAALEALAMECPVVSSAIGGMPEMLAQGGGWTYRTGDVDGLIQCLQRVIAAESTRKSLATEGRAAVVRCFSLESMVAEFRALIQQKPP
jgi:glycosyltransferase involved in cell wall biosynthesis